MVNLIRDGGVPMWFILAFGCAALVAAAGYAAKKARPLGLIYGLAGATLFSTLSATCADFGATFAHVSGHPDAGTSDLLLGAGESMSPGILGFSLLALVCFLVGVGVHRRALDEEV
jgi:hypothetical protein